MKIGYQGIEGSNSYNAALLFIENQNIRDAELIPLITSENVVENLKTKAIDLGICAIENNTTGEVYETKKALDNLKINIIDNIYLRICHCLFVLDKSVKINDIKYIASHEQALKQCEKYLNTKFKNQVEIIKAADTAICAKELKNKKLNKYTGIIVNKQAGLINNLFLVEKQIEDNKNNKTKFIVFSL